MTFEPYKFGLFCSTPDTLPGYELVSANPIIPTNIKFYHHSSMIFYRLEIKSNIIKYQLLKDNAKKRKEKTQSPSVYNERSNMYTI